MYPSVVCISSKAMVGFFRCVLNNSPSSISCRETQYMLRMFSVRRLVFYNGPLFFGYSPLFCLSHVEAFLEAPPSKMCQSYLYHLIFYVDYPLVPPTRGSPMLAMPSSGKCVERQSVNISILLSGMVLQGLEVI